MNANDRKTHCPVGHAYDAGNTLVKFTSRRRLDGGRVISRTCRACERDRMRRARASRREALAPA